MMYDYLVVGSGLYGAIFAHEAKKMGKSVIVVTHSKKIADAADVVLKIHEGKLYHLV